MSKSKESACVDAVNSYLLKTNRPYSVQDIFNNLHKEHGKTAVVKALETLVADGKIIEKTYNKQKIYFVNQAHFSAASDEALKEMDMAINSYNVKLKEIQEKIKQNQMKLSTLNNSLSIKEIEMKISETKDHLIILRKRYDLLEKKMVNIDPKENDLIRKKLEAYRIEHRKRKRIVDNMIDTILEGYPKNKKALYEEIGLEI